MKTLLLGILFSLPVLANAADAPRPEDQFTEVTVTEVQLFHQKNILTFDKKVVSDDGLLLFTLDGKTTRVPFYPYYFTHPKVEGVPQGRPTFQVLTGTADWMPRLKGQKAIVLTLHYPPIVQ